MTYDNEIRLLADGIPPGHSSRKNCPACGQLHCVISRVGEGLAYKCHRNSCGLAGFVGQGSVYAAPPTAQKLRAYDGRLGALTKEDRRYFADRFGLYDLAGQIKVATDEDAYALEIQGPNSARRGVVIRQPRWKGKPAAPRVGLSYKPKASIYQDVEGAPLAWYPVLGISHMVLQQTLPPRPLVVVEDQLSALRANQCGYRSVALLGTLVTMTNGQVAEIARGCGYGGVLLALDSDATDTAFKIGRKWGMAFHKFRIAILDEDVKDLNTDDDVRRVLGV